MGKESLIKRKFAERKMLTAEIGVYLLIEKINDAGKESLIKENLRSAKCSPQVWYARCDSNARPSESESDTLSN